MTSMNVPEPVMSLAVQPVSKDSGGQVSEFCVNIFVSVFKVFGVILIYFFSASFRRL